MTEDQQPATTKRVRRQKHKQKTGLQPTTVGLLVFIALLLGVVAGVRSNDILSVMGPMFGVKIHAGTVDLSTVQDTYRALKANFAGELDDQKLIDGANKGLVAAAGDRYTTFMTAEETKSFNNELSGSIGGGIGAEIGMRNDTLTIIRTLKDNPAAQAGLHNGDSITAVNDESTAGWTVEQVVEKIRGEVGTTVKIGVLRDGAKQEFTVTRASVTNPSVSHSVQDGIGIITLGRFDKSTGAEARAAANDVKKQGVHGVILDLRGNGGGYLQAATDVSGIWLNDKVVVTERVNGKTTETLKATGTAVLEGMPTIVLINGGSASASEIVAGALQDHKAATLLGETSFGKGSVQKLVSLMGGAQLKVTVARWYTPNGQNINEQGIAPDTKVGFSQEDANKGIDPQLEAAVKKLSQ